MSVHAATYLVQLVGRGNELVGRAVLPAVKPMPAAVLWNARCFLLEREQPEAMLQREPRYLEAFAWPLAYGDLVGEVNEAAVSGG